MIYIYNIYIWLVCCTYNNISFLQAAKGGDSTAALQTADSDLLNGTRCVFMQFAVLLSSSVGFRRWDSKRFKSWMIQTPALFLRRTWSRVTPAKSVVVLKCHKTNDHRRVHVRFP